MTNKKARTTRVQIAMRLRKRIFPNSVISLSENAFMGSNSRSERAVANTNMAESP